MEFPEETLKQSTPNWGLIVSTPTWTYLELSQMDVGQFFLPAAVRKPRQTRGTVHHFPVKFEMESASIPLVVTNHITVQAVAEISGCSLQYICRLLFDVAS